jgi:poly-gamma-glutamate synthesis protein (capsule biosynthesis protein)
MVKQTTMATAFAGMLLIASPASAEQAASFFWPENTENMEASGETSSEHVLQGTGVADQPWRWSKKADGEVDILLLGDTNISYRDDPDAAFGALIPTLRAADVAFANLEGPFAGGTDDPEKSDIRNKDWRHSNADQVAGLVAAGFDAVGVANNVSAPPAALLRSLDVLDKAGIATTGGGKNMAAARKPVILKRNGVRVGILQYTALYDLHNHVAGEASPGVAPIRVDTAFKVSDLARKPGRPLNAVLTIHPASGEALRADIEALAKKTDVQIVSFHWGLSDANEIVGYEDDIARLCIDAGADVVFGHGSHRMKPVEVYKGKPIIYDSGQGLFDDRRNWRPVTGNRSQRYPEGILVRVKANKDGLTGAEFAPIWRDVWGDDQLRIYKPDSPVGRYVMYDIHLRARAADMGNPFSWTDDYVVIDGVGAAP